LLVALAAVVIVTASALLGRSPSADGQSQSGVGGAVSPDASRFTMVTESLGDKRVAAMVIDARTMRLLVYAFDFNKNRMQLVAVRDITQDVSLTQYNNARPWPEDIRKMLEAGQGEGRENPSDDGPR
jgi:hypothetical protein